MDIIKRRMRDRGVVEFPVYTKAEADKKGIRYSNWKDVNEGEWSLSDDGYVAQCIKRKTYVNVNKLVSAMITLPYGITWTRAKKLEYLPRKASKNYHSVRPMRWDEQESARARTKRTVKAYAIMLYNGTIDWDRLGIIYRPDQKVPRATVKRLFKQDRIQKMASEELNKLMESQGVTKGLAIKILKKAAEIAEAKGDANAMLKAADNILELYGEKGKKVVTEQIEASTQNISGLIEEEKKKLIATRTTEEPL